MKAIFTRIQASFVHEFMIISRSRLVGLVLYVRALNREAEISAKLFIMTNKRNI